MLSQHLFQTPWAGTPLGVLLTALLARSATFPFTQSHFKNLPSPTRLSYRSVLLSLSLLCLPEGLWMAFQTGYRWCGSICNSRAFSSRKQRSLSSFFFFFPWHFKTGTGSPAEVNRFPHTFLASTALLLLLTSYRTIKANSKCIKEMNITNEIKKKLQKVKICILLISGT